MTPLYPFIYIFSASVSASGPLGRGEIWLLPKGFNLEAYKTVMKDNSIWQSYYNTVWYVVVGTIINLIMTTVTAYPLSRKKFSARNTIMMFIAFTMFFGGGLVPSYLLMKTLRLLDTRWEIGDLIIMRTFFEGIPESLHEAATIDGCSELKILVRIFLPLSMPVIAVMILFYAVAHWNSFFPALMYINDQTKYPLQIHLRKILIQYEQNDILQDVNQGRDVIAQSVRYAVIIVSTLPILMIYPFLQKYFVKGVMIGAIKG
jgi:putative aldouronate transport system permease protein